ncbi:MAG: tyrosine--tRNA ligase [Candidatus Paceibacterota bacterium]
MFGFKGRSTDTSEEKIDELLTRGVSEVIEKDSLKRELLSGKQLRIKLGIDPTSPNIHLGRSITLLKLRDFQMLGHKIIFIVGDATGIIGDTSDKESERPMLTREEVEANAKTYLEQAGKILDMALVEKKYNSGWLDALTYKEIGDQANIFSVSDFTARENIKKRLDEGKRVSLREMLYPLMQGYDSVMVRADVEIGGTDQRFNMLAGRKLQPLYKQKPQNILTTELVEGLDGRKMSSSWGNTINLTASPADMYGKVMRLKDELIVKYLTLATRVSLKKISEVEKKLKDGVNPKEVKMLLAREIVTFYYNEKEAEKAEKEFQKIFSEGGVPEEISRVKVKKDSLLSDILIENKILDSKSEFRRLVDQGGVELGGEKITSHKEGVRAGVLKLGKHRFFEIEVS